MHRAPGTDGKRTAVSLAGRGPDGGHLAVSGGGAGSLGIAALQRRPLVAGDRDAVRTALAVCHSLARAGSRGGVGATPAALAVGGRGDRADRTNRGALSSLGKAGRPGRIRLARRSPATSTGTLSMPNV